MLDPDDETLAGWHEKERISEAMVPVVGELYRERDIVTSICGRSLVRCSAVEIIKAHRYARQVIGRELHVSETAPILDELATLGLPPARIDLGRLAIGYDASVPLKEYLEHQMTPLMAERGGFASAPTDVVLYGFGRIGRLLARILLERTGSGSKLRLRAIVLRPGGMGEVEKRASLLRRDSVHGPFKGTITSDKESGRIVANGNTIQVIEATDPASVDYTSHGIDNAIVIDNTGKWRDDQGLGLHLQSPGVSRVLLTAPGKGTVKNIIFGVNHADIEDQDRLISAASCTTNAIVPVLKVIDDRWNILSGHLETVHAYTNDQNLNDNFHKKERRGRSAPLNLVITETGAATAVAKALPQLAGKLTGNAIRVPTPNVSLAILNLSLERDVDKTSLNRYLRKLSVASPYRDQIDYISSPEVVSSDFVGSERAGIVDSTATITSDRRCVLYVWYDNEAGYSYQVVRIAQEMAGLRYPAVP